MGGFARLPTNQHTGSGTSAVLTNLRSNMTAVAGLAVLSPSATIASQLLVLLIQKIHICVHPTCKACVAAAAKGTITVTLSLQHETESGPSPHICFSRCCCRPKRQSCNAPTAAAAAAGVRQTLVPPSLQSPQQYKWCSQQTHLQQQLWRRCFLQSHFWHPSTSN